MLPFPDDVFTVGRKRGRSAEDEVEDCVGSTEHGDLRREEEVDVSGSSAPIAVVDAVASSSNSGPNAHEETYAIAPQSRKGSASSSSSSMGAAGGEKPRSNKKKRAIPPAVASAIGSLPPLFPASTDPFNPSSSRSPYALSLLFTSDGVENGAASGSSSSDGQLPLNRLPVGSQDSLHLHQIESNSSHSHHSYGYDSEHERPPLDPSLIQHGHQPVDEHQQALRSDSPALLEEGEHRFPSANQQQQEVGSNSLDLHLDQEISAEQMQLKQLDLGGEQRQQQMDIRHPQMTPQHQQASTRSFYESISAGLEAQTGLQLGLVSPYLLLFSLFFPLPLTPYST